MLKLLEPLAPFTAFTKYKTDNFVFRLHAKITVLFILTCSIIVTGYTFIGDPIECMVNKDIPQGVMDTYCWIHSTFTLPKRIMMDDEYSNEVTAHPGVGNQLPGEEETNHKYYQWVCFTLFFQAILFYLPKWFWKRWEAGHMSKIIPDDLIHKESDKRLPRFPKPIGVIDEETLEKKVNDLKVFFYRHYSGTGSRLFSVYFVRFLFCETLNLINCIGQIFFVNLFLGGMFTTYGVKVWHISQMDPEDRYDPMNLIFPKVAKCTFYRSGPSGTIETFDGLCVLPVNIINEKIYIFLWYWLVILAIITTVYMGYRVISILSSTTRKKTLEFKCHGFVPDLTLEDIMKNINRGDWFFLCQLGSNIDPHVFSKVLREIEKDFPQPQANGKSIKSA